MNDIELQKQISKRRTFAIISHPDAGKTTLTEKLLLYGGAIHLAGAVKAKKNQRNTASDWMEIEKQRGISISASVLQFEYQSIQVNLLDTPGHKDFSEDTYRTLTAADSAVMLMDAAKGVEPQTRKLFEVCKMRGLPIFTFMNKLDRPSREPLDLLDELEKVLGIQSCPMTWPIGMGDRFKGVYDRQTKEILLFQTEGEANVKQVLKPVQVSGIHDPKFLEIIGGDSEIYEQFKSEIELLETAGDSFDLKQTLEGNLTPVFFGSAMNNFGVERFLENFIKIAPSPYGRQSDIGIIDPDNKNFSAFVFKIQANMDPKHRDRVAFLRICSGRFEKNLETHHVRLRKLIKLSRPLHFFGQDRVVIEEAYAGDIIGVVDTTGTLRIGDTLTTGRLFSYEPIPSFLPEYFARTQLRDPMKRKQLRKGLEQLSEEGVIQIYRDRISWDKDPVLAAVGALQFEVLKSRLEYEYNVHIEIESLPYAHARWIKVKDAGRLKDFEGHQDWKLFLDRDNNPLILFKNDWALRYAQDHSKDVEFFTRPMVSA